MTDAALLDRSATEQAQLLRKGEVSPAELMEATLAAIDDQNPSLNAIVTLSADTACDEARLRTPGGNDSVGPLWGVPFTLKDTIEVGGMLCTAGSLLLSDYVPSTTASVVDRIRAAGAIVVGKTNCPEFGTGNLDTDNLLFGRTANPWQPTRSPGGSSGGESAAVAAGLSGFGIGTDYGGSVRFPAHCTGVAALRPTPGTVGGDGVLPHRSDLVPEQYRRSRLQSELQTVGFIARSIADLRLLLSVTAQVPAVRPGPVRSVEWFVSDGEHTADVDVSTAVEHAADALAAAGLTVRNSRPAGFERAAAVLAQLRATEPASEVEWLAQGRHDELTALVAAELDRRPAVPTPELHAEVSVLRSRVLGSLSDDTVLLMPVGLEPAFDPESFSGPRAHLEAFCRAVTLLGLPAAAVPCGTARNGLPISVQVAGRPGHDLQVLEVAALLEDAFGRWRPRSATARAVTS